MTADIDLINKSFAEISPRVDELTLTFYTGLFSTYPEAKPLFSHIDLISQRRKLAAMLTLIVTQLNRMDVLVPVLRELGASHVAYGATEETYEWVKDALLAAIARVSGDLWTAETESAWSSAIDIVCREMLHGAERQEASGIELQSEEINLLMEIASNPLLSFKADSLFTSYIEKKTNDHEIHLATEVQQSLIPEDFPTLDGYHIDAAYIPAMQVGGDFYDWIMPNPHQLHLAFGDVSGKGLSGALIGCRLFGVARSILSADVGTADAVAGINAHMCDRMPPGRFITLAVLSIDLQTHEFSLTNAGHQPPLLRTADGKLELLNDPTTGGIPIGIDANVKYGQYAGQLAPNASLTFYSDGITEAMGNQSDLFGDGRLLKGLEQLDSSRDLTKTLVSNVQAFSRGYAQSDDISVLTLVRD